jgi:adenine-specific DNA-methyltransferase
MAKIEITKTKLVWPGKYNEDGTLKEVPRVSLPFQVIEAVNESRATREAQKLPQQSSLFEVWEGKEGDTFESGWKNKLIWGDNLLVIGSLLEKLAGKIDLIYIDPPFATGADFSFTAAIGETGTELFKEQSVIEEKAYRDTWGRGFDSYLSMMYERLALGAELLSPVGIVFVHCDWHVGSYLKALLDAVFGADNFINEVIWQKIRSSKGQSRGFGNVHDTILVYGKSETAALKRQFVPLDPARIEQHYSNVEPGTNRRYMLDNFAQAGQGETRHFGKKNLPPPPGKHWIWSQERIDQGITSGRIVITSGGMPRVKRYLDESKGNPLEDIWADIPPINSQSAERLDYATQKPEALLSRILGCIMKDSALIMDFFAGSGTTLAVAERLGHRWIGCDLGRWAIHVTRKTAARDRKLQAFRGP